MYIIPMKQIQKFATIKESKHKMKEIIAKQKEFNDIISMSDVSDLSEKEREELEEVWHKIPTKFTSGIDNLTIEANTSKVSGGEHTDGLIRVFLGIGSGSSLAHEIHHYMWFYKRTPNQQEKWKYGVRKIIQKYGKTPTKYSDSFHQVELNDIIIGEEKLKQLKTKNKKNIDINLILGVDKALKWYDKRISLSGYNNIQMNEKTYTSLSDDIKIKTINELKYKHVEDVLELYDMFYNTNLYNESHSEVGAFIYAKESMIKRAECYDPKIPEWDHRINYDVIDKYVELYEEVFGIDYE